MRYLSNYIHYFVLPSILILVLGSCNQSEKLMYMNSESGLSEIQEEIEALIKTKQIDSLSIRSSEGASLMSSIYILATDSESKEEFKSTIEFIPKVEMTQEKPSTIKKDALHDYKINLKDLYKQIESAKGMIPQGYKYQDVKSIRYSANPFGEKYYFELEVKPLSKDISEDNEYIDWYNSNSNTKYQIQTGDLDANSLHAKRTYVVLFVVENGSVQIVKVK